MTNEDNILLTPDCLGIEAKRAALDRLLRDERDRAIRDCKEAVSKCLHAPECRDDWSITRNNAFIESEDAILALLKKGDTK